MANTKDIMTRLSLEVDGVLVDALKPYAQDGRQKDLIRAALYAYMGLDFPPDLVAAGFTAMSIPDGKGQQTAINPEVLLLLRQLAPLGRLPDVLEWMAGQVAHPSPPPSPKEFPPLPAHRTTRGD